MTVVGSLELLAWVLSAVIAAWLLVDMIRVSLRYDEELLTNPGEQMAGASGETRSDGEGAGRHEH